MAHATTKENKISKEDSIKKKGPKVIIKEDLIKMDRNPLTLGNKSFSERIDYETADAIQSEDDIVVERYNPDVKKGLSNKDVEARLLAGLKNSVDQGSSKSLSSIIFSNLFTFFNFLNFSIAVWLLTAGASFANFFFLGAVTANLIIGIIQEYRAKKTIDKLSLLAAPTGHVIRDKTEYEISVSNVVIDDILYLNSGKQIAADCVIREGIIEVNESLLTGESDPILKKQGDTLYSGSFVVSGSGYAQVTAIGKDVYLQKLTEQAKKYQKPNSDLMASLKIIIRTVAGLIVPIAGALIYLSYFVNGETYEQVVLGTTGAMIGIIPSGLFLLTSMALAVGVVRLAQNNTLVQELYCIEMLARTDMLCLDKTGTITDGTMTVKSTIEIKNYPQLTIKNIVSGMLNALNDPNLTSQALSDHFGKTKRIRHKNTIPFSSSRKYSAVEFDKYGTFFIGAPEYILKSNYPDKVKKIVDSNAKEGYRVLLLAHSNEKINANNTFSNVQALSLIIIEDSIRPDAIDTLQYFKENGVNIKVISGDNPVTVSKIAQRVFLENAEKFISLEGLTDKEVIRSASRFTVFGRVSPHQKKILIEALKNNGHTVAMTGDGVNDILALKEADTSIAMASGSEAARNVSHLVLLDSNFSSMPKVVLEGRRVINNVQKVAVLFLTKNIFTLFLIIISLIRGDVYPIKPSQLILIDYLVIGIPSLILALEANKSRVEGDFLINVIKKALPGSLVVLFNSLIIYAFSEILFKTRLVDGIYVTNETQVSTAIILTATFTSLLVLLRLSIPFNRTRMIMFSIMISAFFLAIIYIPSFFGYSPFYAQDYYPVEPFTVGQILLLTTLFQASFPMMHIMSNSSKWIKGLINKFLERLR